jgi:hypothetical protein
LAPTARKSRATASQFDGAFDVVIAGSVAAGLASTFLELGQTYQFVFHGALTAAAVIYSTVRRHGSESWTLFLGSCLQHRGLNAGPAARSMPRR